MVQEKFKIKSKNALSSLTESVLSLAKNNSPVAESPRAYAVGEITIDEIIESTGGLVTDLQPEDRLYMETVVDDKYEARATTVGSIAEFGRGGVDPTLYALKTDVDAKDLELKTSIDTNTTNIDAIINAPLTPDADVLGTEEILSRKPDGTITTINQAVLAGSGGGELPDLTEYAKLEDLDTATKFTAINPMTFPPIKEPLDKILVAMFDMINANVKRVFTIDASAIIDCASIGWVYNVLNINMISDATEDIKIINIAFSNIKNITANVTKAVDYIFNEDFTVNATSGVNNLFTISKIQNNISFCRDDASELFSCKIPRFSGVQISGIYTIATELLFKMPFLDDNKTCFAIEFSQDLANVISYFNIDEFFIPLGYVKSTTQISIYNEFLVYWVCNPQNNKSFADVVLTTIYGAEKDFLVDGTPISVLDSSHHVLGLINRSISQSLSTAIPIFLKTVSQMMVSSSGNSAPLTLTAKTPITSILSLNGLNGLIDIASLKEHRDSNSGNCTEFRKSDQELLQTSLLSTTSPETIANQTSFGEDFVASYTSSLDASSPVTPVKYTKFGFGSEDGFVAVFSITYFEKGEFSFPAG